MANLENTGVVTGTKIYFNFYGFQIEVSSERDGLLQDCNIDFSWFRAPKRDADLSMHIRRFSDRPEAPPLPAIQHTPRNVVFRDGSTSYLDYSGRALSIYYENGKRFEIFCDDRHLAHEITYLTILSYVGSHLDRKGMIRVHGLGLEVNGKAVLILLPMSGGKTTMALRMLQNEGIRLLSEDSPLIQSNGQVLPFPLRIGVRPGTEPPDVPPDKSIVVERMEFGPKTLIDISTFQSQLAPACPVGAILLGQRWLAGDSSITPLPRHVALKPFITNAVVGLGLYQGVEFVLQKSAVELIGQGRVAARRLRASLAVIRKAQVYRFAMGPNIDDTAATLLRFLRELSSRRL